MRQCKFTAELDPGFMPAAIWNENYRSQVKACGNAVEIVVALTRSNGAVSAWRTSILPHDSAENKALNIKYVERAVKFLLWMKGGCTLTVAGCDDLAEDLRRIYAADGVRKFDFAMMGDRIYGKTFEVKAVALADAPETAEPQVRLGGNFNGCRIGFDLGGSDRKCAAVIDGKCVHTEEVVWDPYFQKDPAYHKDGIRDSLLRAAAHLPRIDGIGGSAAGVYVNNQPRLASLFRGVSDEDFTKYIVPVFDELAAEFNVPFVVANDGEVTALAGAISMESNGVLGMSMGTSEAGGYVTQAGNITDWLNELAFCPVDYRDDAPMDEWSGDGGCGAQYFSQQAVARLAPAAGFDFPQDMPFPKRLEAVQEAMEKGDDRARSIYATIGVYFGYSIAHYAEFYDISKLLILGRVTSGAGGELIIETGRKVLESEFPELAAKIELRVPDEQFKRHGQAVIAASLPEIR